MTRFLFVSCQLLSRRRVAALDVSFNAADEGDAAVLGARERLRRRAVLSRSKACRRAGAPARTARWHCRHQRDCECGQITHGTSSSDPQEQNAAVARERRAQRMQSVAKFGDGERFENSRLRLAIGLMRRARIDGFAIPFLRSARCRRA